MTAMVLAGGMVGLGLFLLTQGVRRSRPPLAVSLARLRGLPTTHGTQLGVPAATGWRDRLGRSVLATLGAAGMELTSLREDLQVTGRSVEELCASKLLTGAGLAVVPLAFAALLSMVGLGIGPLIPAWMTITFGIGGFILPDARLRAEAAERRRSFRHAVGAYLTQVSINLAGGAAPEEALHRALRVSRGWAFARIDAALAHARLVGQAPWVALGQLGQLLGVSELGELAASLDLAGSEGAKVRESLTAKAAALRRHETAEAEVEAAAATERMVFPIVLLALGFVLFVMYPALTQVIASL